VDWVCLAQDWGQWRDFMNMVMNPHVPYSVENFLTSWGPVSFSERTLLHGVSFFPRRNNPLVGQGFLIVEASWSHADTPHSVGLIWASDRPDAETSTFTTQTLTIDRHPCPRRDWNPQTHASDRAATGIGTLKLQFKLLSRVAARMASYSATARRHVMVASSLGAREAPGLNVGRMFWLRFFVVFRSDFRESLK
jgi:hypothetical protein